MCLRVEPGKQLPPPLAVRQIDLHPLQVAAGLISLKLGFLVVEDLRVVRFDPVQDGGSFILYGRASRPAPRLRTVSTPDSIANCRNSSMIRVRSATVQATTREAGIASEIFLPRSPASLAAKGSWKRASLRSLSSLR